MKMILTLLTMFFLAGNVQSQLLKTGIWRGSLLRQDGNEIAFNFEVKQQNGKNIFIIHNAAERIEVSNITFSNDSCFVIMPVFESQFRLKIISNDQLQGVWIKGTSTQNLLMPFKAEFGKKYRYHGTGKPGFNISGRWAATFISNNENEEAIAEFSQKGQKLSGTFLTSTGDYRYLEGVVQNDLLQLSGFDGGHAYYFSGKIIDATHIEAGMFMSGLTYKQQWIAEKNATAALAEDAAAMYLKPGEDRLNFSFPDLDSKKISINDERFHNKVVVIQLMGSWCPNCMDETAFLSEFYNKNKERGIEVISLAYEYSEDFERSQKNLRKFQQYFNVQYPMLITGVKAGDTLRTQKTLPQLTPIKMFPTTIFIGKDGKVKKIDTGFNGPGTGAHYEEYKKKFNTIISELIEEKY